MAKSPVIHLEKRLDIESQDQQVVDVARWRYFDNDDAPAWLTLRKLAIQTLMPKPGAWSLADFRREFIAKTWWNPQRMLLIDGETSGQKPPLVASITFAGDIDSAGIATLHWLLVHPDHRRRGLARRLIAAAESLARQLGARTVTLETHANWCAAVALYRSLGYQEPSDRPDPLG